jgi:hypothetical protein
VVLWAFWLIATGLSWTVATTVVLLLSRYAIYLGLFGQFIATEGGSVVLNSILGPVVGIGQWPVLRGCFGRASRWLTATTLGWLVGLATGAIAARLVLVIAGYPIFECLPASVFCWASASNIVTEVQAWTIGGLLCSLCFGLVQWLYLRKALPGSRSWVLATLVGSFLCGFFAVAGQYAVLYLFFAKFRLEDILAAWFPVPAIGFFAAAVTGLTLARLCARQKLEAGRAPSF